MPGPLPERVVPPWVAARSLTPSPSRLGGCWWPQDLKHLASTRRTLVSRDPVHLINNNRRFATKCDDARVCRANSSRTANRKSKRRKFCPLAGIHTFHERLINDKWLLAQRNCFHGNFRVIVLALARTIESWRGLLQGERSRAEAFNTIRANWSKRAIFSGRKRPPEYCHPIG